VLLTFLTAFAVSLVLVFICRAAARRFGYTAQPRGDRWHKRPTALLGGVAIALTVILLQLAFPPVAPIAPLLAGASLIFLLGLVDDVVSLRPYTKLVAEIAIASAFVFFGYRLNWFHSMTLDALFTLVWIIGLTNAFNLLDNMDGLSAGVGLIAGSSLLGALLLNNGAAGGTPETHYLALLLGSLAGFLVYNVYPASIFMGDSGALFIGMSLAMLSLTSPGGTNASTNLLSIVIGPLLVLVLPIFDTTLVTVSRLLSGRSPAQGGRDHSSHRLVALGLSERWAVAVLWGLAALSGGLALSIRRFQTEWSSVAAVLFILALIIFAVYLARVRVYEEDEQTRDGILSGRLTPFVVHLMYKRRIAEVLLDMCLVSVAYYSAYRLRFGGAQFGAYFPNFLSSLPLIVGVQMVSLYLAGAYRGIWQYFGLMDGVSFVKGVFFGTLSSVCIIVYMFRFEHYSRGVFVIDGALLLLLLCGSRASFRLISEFVHRRQRGGQRLVIYGSGDVGASAVRDILSRAPGGYRMLGFIDDDPKMLNVRMQGFPVLGGWDSLVSLITNGAVDTVVITRLIDVQRLESLQAICAEHRVGLSQLHFRLDQLVAVS